MPQKVSAKDVAKYIIELSQQIGEPVTNMKLQKLLYYSYAWYLVETNKEKRLFAEPIVAWKYGPVIEEIYHAYQNFGADVIDEAEDGDSGNLSESEKALIEDVFKTYGSMNGIELANLTHSEQPWLQSYEDGKENVISDELIFAFYKAKGQRLAQV